MPSVNHRSTAGSRSSSINPARRRPPERAAGQPDLLQLLDLRGTQGSSGYVLRASATAKPIVVLLQPCRAA
jgi:hypothetical protein